MNLNRYVVWGCSLDRFRVPGVPRAQWLGALEGIKQVRSIVVTMVLGNCLIGGLTSASIQINEIRIDEPGSDVNEYFELFSTVKGASLDGLTYVVIGDGVHGSGHVEEVVTLSGFSFPRDDAYFLVAQATSLFSGIVPDLRANLAFENSDNVTHLLVRGFVGSLGDDLDLDDDGILDSLPWERVLDSVSLIESEGGGDQVYAGAFGGENVGPSGSFVPGHVFREGLTGRFMVGRFGPVGETDTPGSPNSRNDVEVRVPMELSLSEIQGVGDGSPYLGERVSSSGIVVGDFQESHQLNGFFLQDPIGDGDSRSSDGIFVYDPGGTNVSVGDLVQVSGMVTEFFGLTEINQVSSVLVSGRGVIDPVRIRLPLGNSETLERFEGMLVEIIPVMTVCQSFFLGRYGQITLASPDELGVPGRLFQSTHRFRPGPKAESHARKNQQRRLVLDDGRSGSGAEDFLGTVSFIGPAPGRVVRGGDQVIGLTGVLDYGRVSSSNARDFRLQPVKPPISVPVNPRPGKISLQDANLRVASFNVLNYFATLEGRGARTAVELALQRDKLVAAMASLDADIIGLVELENDSGAATEHLLTGLNAVVPRPYEFIDTGRIGSDAIKVGLFYRSATVKPVGSFAILDDAVDARALSDWNRPPLAQSFVGLDTGDVFTVVVNHFKSKGSPCDSMGDPDLADGQGNCNGTRSSMAMALRDWLLGDPTGVADDDVLIMGDLNAYAKEDPIFVLREGSFKDLLALFRGEDAYTYTFDGQAGYFDHALGSPAITTKVSAVTDWHINADEPAFRDYRGLFGDWGYSQADAYRSSDHDPVVVDLLLVRNVAPVANDDVVSVWQGEGFEVSFEALLANDVDLNGDALSVLRFDGRTRRGKVLSGDHGRLFCEDGLTQFPDDFDYVIVDGQGGEAVGTVTIRSRKDERSRLLVSEIRSEKTGVKVGFIGESGQTYVVESTESLLFPDWHSRAEVVADALGYFDFVDESATSPMGFFRARAIE